MYARRAKRLMNMIGRPSASRSWSLVNRFIASPPCGRACRLKTLPRAFRRTHEGLSGQLSELIVSRFRMFPGSNLWGDLRVFYMISVYLNKNTYLSSTLAERVSVNSH
jgi:hypothetical protein